MGAWTYTELRKTKTRKHETKTVVKTPPNKIDFLKAVICPIMSIAAQKTMSTKFDVPLSIATRPVNESMVSLSTFRCRLVKLCVSAGNRSRANNRAIHEAAVIIFDKEGTIRTLSPGRPATFCMSLIRKMQPRGASTTTTAKR